MTTHDEPTRRIPMSATTPYLHKYTALYCGVLKQSDGWRVFHSGWFYDYPHPTEAEALLALRNLQRFGHPAERPVKRASKPTP